MQRIVFAAIFSALSISSLANEMHEQEGIGYSKTRMKACDDAMLFIKKEALLSAGVIPIPAAPTSENTAHSSVTQNKAVEENQPGDELVKVLSKDEDVRMNSGGNYVCRVKAKISVDIENVVKHNSAFKGKLPDWVIAPPRKSGKITVIENDATLDGAIARTLLKYAEKVAGENERIGQIQKLLNYKSEPYIFEAAINSDISVKWKRKYYMYGDKNDAYFIHTFSEQTIFKKNGKVRQISTYREIESANGFVSNFEDESSGETKGRFNINKATATLSMLVDSLKNSGFEIQYQQVASGKNKKWYVLLVGDPSAKPS